MNKTAFIDTDQYEGELGILVQKALSGKAADIDSIMNHLNSEISLVMSRYVDFALSLVDKPEGIYQIALYLFNGNILQRNYASLYFNRLHEWQLVKKAYELGLIDETQAYCR
jgi:hypothetical protein